jgi:hypothetical protein
LQRKCACGQHTIAGGECDSCKNKRLQRNAGREANPAKRRVILSGVPPSGAVNSAAHGFMRHIEGDFNKVRLRTSKTSMQTKLIIGESGDMQEQEADRVAQAVMRPEPVPGLGDDVVSEVSPLAAVRLQRTPKAPEITDEATTQGKKGTVFQAKVGQVLVRFFLNPGEGDKEKQIRANLVAMTNQITTMNALMADPAYAVQQLLIWTGATSGFRIVLGAPAIYVDSKYAVSNDVEAVTHEMGHAILYSYSQASTKQSSTQKGPPLQNVVQKLAELYLQLKDTKQETFGSLGVASDTLKKTDPVSLGLFMVDPSNWAGSKETEHPWDNFDEFFASAFAGFLINRKGLESSIAKFARKDARITALGKELIALLEVFKTKKYPEKGYSLTDKSKAESEIQRAGGPPQIVKKPKDGKETLVYPEVIGHGPGQSTPEAPIKPPLLYLVNPETVKEEKLQRRAIDASEGSLVPPIVHDVLNSPGQPLDQSLRDFFEPRFGHDFSQVRVHSDAKAAESARAVNALAYTVGQDVVFGLGQYAPAAGEGQNLLAHELAHVVQQSAGPGGLAARLDRKESKPPTPVKHGKLSFSMEEDPTKGKENVTIVFSPDPKGPQTKSINLIQIAKVVFDDGTRWTDQQPKQAALDRFTTGAGFHVDVKPEDLPSPRKNKTDPNISPAYPPSSVQGQSKTVVDPLSGLSRNVTQTLAPQPGHNLPGDVLDASINDTPGGGISSGVWELETVAHSDDLGIDYGAVRWGFHYEGPGMRPRYTQEKSQISAAPSSNVKESLVAFNKYYMNKHIVQEGETLKSISTDYYGDDSQAASIFANNKGVLTDSNPDARIAVGTELEMPGRKWEQMKSTPTENPWERAKKTGAGAEQ